MYSICTPLLSFERLNSDYRKLSKKLKIGSSRWSYALAVTEKQGALIITWYQLNEGRRVRLQGPGRELRLCTFFIRSACGCQKKWYGVQSKNVGARRQTVLITKGFMNEITSKIEDLVSRMEGRTF